MAHLDRSAIGSHQPVVLNVVDHLVDDAPEQPRPGTPACPQRLRSWPPPQRDDQGAEEPAEHAVVPRPRGKALATQPLRFQTPAGDGLIDRSASDERQHVLMPPPHRCRIVPASSRRSDDARKREGESSRMSG